METVSLPLLARDAEARFRALYISAVEDVIRFVQRRTVPAQVEDVVADAFLVAWRRVDELPHDLSEARAWLFGIARRCLLNAIRSSGRQEALAVRLAQAPHSLALTVTDAVETQADLGAAWRKLDASDQEAISLNLFEELTSSEAGQVLGISPPAYRVRLMRARRSLRRHMDQELLS